MRILSKFDFHLLDFDKITYGRITTLLDLVILVRYLRENFAIFVQAPNGGSKHNSMLRE